MLVLWNRRRCYTRSVSRTLSDNTTLTPVVPSIPGMLRVSIIIPALNEEPLIGTAVEKARATRPHEIIVVDGGSRDATAEVAAELGALVVASPRGRGRQQNVGARLATGDVLLFIHADNWLDQRGLDQIQTSLADPKILGGAFRQQIEAAGRLYRWLEQGNAWRARRRGLPYGDQGIFLRRETFLQLGGFPDVELMEDLLLMRRFREIARPILLPGPLHVSPRRWQQHGIIRQTLRNWSLQMAQRLGVSPERLARFYQ